MPEIPMRKVAASSFLCIGVSSLLLLSGRPASAAWSSDPTVNVPLCTAMRDQLWPAAVSDGAGGAIVAWTDVRGGTDYSYSDIYVQRISRAGVPLWAPNGVPLCTASGDQSDTYLAIVSDGAGGAIVAWNDFRSGTNFQIYAQRINGAGTPLWTPDGVMVCTAPGSQQTPAIATDGVGGAIITWFDFRHANYDIFAQRISSLGARAWADTGVALCLATGFQEYPRLVPDGAGGAVVAWEDQRTGPDFTYSDIYAQRVSATGIPQWTADGVALCVAAGADQAPSLIPDGAGGALVTWFDYRNGDYDIFAQRVSGAGAPQWTPNGVALCLAAGEQANPSIVPDGSGGGIVAWRDYRGGFEYNLYAQRINATGAPQWTTNGEAFCAAAGDQYDPQLLPDGAGGAIATWPDYRSGGDVYTQRISGSGTPQWTADGVPLCTAAGSQNAPAIVSDGAGGAIITWHDNRGAAADIYAQRVKSNGQLADDIVSAPGASALTLELAGPNPARRGALTVSFSLPTAGSASLELLDVAGRRMVALEVGALGAGSHALQIGEGRHWAPGLYLLRLRQGASVRVKRVAILD
jgi:hypothetical protein